jgi:dolichyl-phosphate-mannose--protein O-mannosyl transferase
MVIGYWLGAEIFQDRRAGWFAAAFMAADGFFIAYSRAALIDGMLTCLVLWSMLAVVAARSWRGVVGAAVLIGLATSIKWSGAMTLIPATAALLVFRRVAWYQIFWFALTPVVHLAIWFAGLHVMGHPTDVASVYGVLKNSFVSLQATGAYDNPLASNWYTWPLLYHPIVVKLSTSGESTRYASSAGNIAFWYPASLLVLGLPLLRGVSLLRQGWRRHYARWIDPDFSRAALLLVLGWAALIAMWTLVLGKHRFFYHYMPSYGFAIVLLAGVAARLERRWPRAVFAFVAVAVAVALFFVPVWCEFPLTENQANIRLLPKPWRP